MMMLKERCKIAAGFCSKCSPALAGFGIFGVLVCFAMAFAFPSVVGNPDE
jgi:hypothetical protein